MKKYLSFKGRASKKEYWMFMLYSLLTIIVLVILEQEVFEISNNTTYVAIYILLALLGSIPTTVRRLHDVGYSAWKLLIFLVPGIGPAWLYFILIGNSEQGENKYGANPKTQKTSNH